MFKTMILAGALLLPPVRGWAATPLLPDLIAWAKQGKYMYDAIIQYDDQGHKKLWFTATVANKGAGPFELRGKVEPDGTTTATQRVYNDDGTYQDYFAGTFQFSGHAGHNHFHFADFAAYNVRTVTPTGGIGPVLASSPKVGFAMWDGVAYDKSLPGAPQQPVYVRPEGHELPAEGISVGWADVYDRTLDEQFVDVTGLPNGDYWLEMIVDPKNHLRETTRRDNTTTIKFRMIDNNVAFYNGPDGIAPPPPLPEAVSDFRVYPNPWRSDRHVGVPVKFTPVPDGVVVKIFNLAGRFVRSVTATSGEANWNVQDGDGKAVSSGYYVYSVDLPGLGRQRGRIAVMH